MSAQYGIWNFDGKLVSPKDLENMRDSLAPHGPDTEGAYIKENVGIFYRGFETIREASGVSQPYVTDSGNVLAWDGRLDNRAALILEIGNGLSSSSSDAVIVAAAYERWGTDSFAKLVGDWTLSFWNPNERLLLLAKDPVGTRPLYYSLEKNQIKWSTLLDPLALADGKTFDLDEEYLAGWFAFFPAADRTPYIGISSVPPSCFVLLHAGQLSVRRYWNFDSHKTIRYKDDAQYEEHFRTAFAESVRRRLRSDHPVLAELSGGMDSSSIVCMADVLIAQGLAETPRLDTVSYYNDAEPNWNERPYFTAVEEQRKRTGCHIEISPEASFSFELESDRFVPTPSAGRHRSEANRRFSACLVSQGNRVVLSGLGGDEVTGGVPTPTPELADLLSEARLPELAHRLKVWALDRRKPWIYLLWDATRGYLPFPLLRVSKTRHPPRWIQPDFRNRHRPALFGYEARTRLFGSRPSFQGNLATLNGLRRQLASTVLPTDPPYEKRYPYLDRDLLEFLWAIPREQLVRPGQRRSLMRRALAAIVPHQILNRKRKAFAGRTFILSFSDHWNEIVRMTEGMVSTSLRIVDSAEFLRVLQHACDGRVETISPLVRTLHLELWLQSLRKQAVLRVCK